MPSRLIVRAPLDVFEKTMNTVCNVCVLGWELGCSTKALIKDRVLCGERKRGGRKEEMKMGGFDN